MENGEMWDSVNLKGILAYDHLTLNCAVHSNVWEYRVRLRNMISFKNLILDELHDINGKR
jgi:hypothetical protein